MAPEETAAAPSTGETSAPEDKATPQAPAGETPKVEAPAQVTVTIDDSTKLPDSHPLVKTLAAQKDKISSQATALAEAQAQSAKATKLEQELAARPSAEAMETLQTRYDRLEAFLVAAGGPLGRALDSRTFSKDLFETDKDIAQLVKDFHKANPSATAAALASTAAGETSSSKQDPNKLLRIASGNA